MKTAVSLPNELFDAAEVLADELGVTRSELYARAIWSSPHLDRTRGIT